MNGTTLQRVSFSMPSGALVTLALFLLMGQMLSDRHGPLPDEPLPGIRFEKVPIPEPALVKPPRTPPERPKPVKPLPPAPAIPRDPVPPLDSIDTSNLPSMGELLPGLGVGNQGGWGNALGGPVKRVALPPQYPVAELVRGVTGEIQVSFLVTERGRTADIRIIASDLPRSFERSVIDAVRRWQFKPAMEDGKPVARRVVEVIEFLLEDG